MGNVIIPNNLPVGYRFHPTDEEYVDYYLKNRVRGFIDHPCIIPDVDICRWDPWELPQKFHGESIIRLDDKVQEWWFFCPQMPQQVKRSTPSGYWKKTGTDRNVKARDTNRVIGSKKTLVFHTGRGSRGVKTNWVIHEYHLPANELNRNYVLCRLKHKRDEKADNSTKELEQGANIWAGWDSDLRQPDHEDSFHMNWIKTTYNSEPSFQFENRVQFSSPNIQQIFQPENQVHCSSPIIQQLVQPENRVQYSSPIMVQPEDRVQYSSPILVQSENRVQCSSPIIIQQLSQPEHRVPCSSPIIQQLSHPENRVRCSSPNIPQLFQPENRAQFSSTIPQMFQPAQRSQISIPPFNIPSNLMNIESPSSMDFSLDNGLTEESIPWESLFRTSEDDEDVGGVQISDYFDADFFAGDQMQTQLQCGQVSNSQEHPVLKENRRTRTIDSFHGFVPLEEKKGMVENKFNGSRITSEKHTPGPVPVATHEPMPPPLHTVSVKYNSKDEEQRFEKVKQETAAKDNKPECTSLDEIAAKAKVKSAPVATHEPMPPPLHTVSVKYNSKDEEQRFEKVKQETAAKDNKPECTSLDEIAAKAKVLKYKEDGSASNSPKQTNSKETEHVKEKSNSVNALTRTITNRTQKFHKFSTA
ncbi:uncharacterized protein LOC104453109 isoform X1 [Eucalyptus grandis]|uniref:uncharacterized protein LOC104453109 isoform X1 n=1 Tax=Eucalyptus grandis TaxID=71139 RepID=UPI00192EB698|nr:uncharacterized protein LOC104453109 isoform X1 [Eucalyptus grandis]